MTSPLAWLCAATVLLVLLWSGCGALRSRRGATPLSDAPEQVERYGDLALITHRNVERSANDGGLLVHDSWSLRWKGQPLVIETMTGMFSDTPSRARTVHAVFVLGSPGKVADLLVNVGDPNNSGAYHLLYQHDGQWSAPMLCPIVAGDSSVMPLGPFEGPPPPPGGFSGPQLVRLTGARWLMLGQRCVLDVAGRRALKVPHWPWDGATEHPSVAPLVPLCDLSPDGRTLVRFGFLRVEAGDFQHLLIVADLEAGELSVLPIDRSRMRYDSVQSVDNAWLHHHFAWRRDADGRDHLQRREDFEPLPWRGTIQPDGYTYALESAQRDPSAVYAEILVRRFQARLEPSPPGETRRHFLVRGESIWVQGPRIMGSWTGADQERKRVEDLIREIAQAIDAELATGNHDALFMPVSGLGDAGPERD